MSKIKVALGVLIVGASVTAFANRSWATTVYMVYQDSFLFTSAANLKQDLLNIGATLTVGGALTDYSAYDEVWEVNYGIAPGYILPSSEQAALRSYLMSGGRVFIAGENNTYDPARNPSIISFVADAGGGTLHTTGTNTTGSGQVQQFTAAGVALNAPNTLAGVEYSTAGLVDRVGSGFLATETSAGSGVGSLVGWDFGDIAGSADARMVVSFDTDMFTTFGDQHNGDHGVSLVENIYEYLRAPLSVPESGTLDLFGLGFFGFGLAARRRRAH